MMRELRWCLQVQGRFCIDLFKIFDKIQALSASASNDPPSMESGVIFIEEFLQIVL